MKVLAFVIQGISSKVALHTGYDVKRIVPMRAECSLSESLLPGTSGSSSRAPQDEGEEAATGELPADIGL